MTRDIALAAALVAAAVSAGSAAESAQDGSGSPMAAREVLRTEAFAERAADAVSGSQFAQRALDLPLDEREAAVLAEVRGGNIPEFLRSLQPVCLGDEVAGETCQVVVWVTPDYLAIGSDDDFLCMPLGLATAATVALEFGFSLPTAKIVDAIYAQAALHLEPQPMTPGAEMLSMDYFRRHQAMVEEQRQGRMTGELTAGHKKDLVLTDRLRQRLDWPRRSSGRVAVAAILSNNYTCPPHAHHGRRPPCRARDSPAQWTK